MKMSLLLPADSVEGLWVLQWREAIITCNLYCSIVALKNCVDIHHCGHFCQRHDPPAYMTYFMVQKACIYNGN